MITDSEEYYVSETIQQTQRSVSHPYEREVVVLLKQAGWSVDELSMVFETGENAIRRLIRQETEASE